MIALNSEDRPCNRRALNNTDAFGFAGAVAFGLEGNADRGTESSAIGFSLVFNVISNDLREGGTLAYLEDSQIDVGGDLNVLAITMSQVFGVVIAATWNSGGTFSSS